MDIVCLSHLRWDFVFQRPQHLMTRAARRHRVLFIEEPVQDPGAPWLETRDRDGVTVAVPHLPSIDPADPAVADDLRTLLRQVLETERIRRPVAWYLTPMAMPWTQPLLDRAAAVVFDCMDDLSGFLGAPGRLRELEVALLGAADVVFTGGQALYEARRELHPNIHAVPSAVDAGHFRQAREPGADPWDLADVPRPRVGYVGVLDERIDWSLIDEAAAARPDRSWVLVGPVVKVDPATLPQRPNLHYLGPKPYLELPAYLRGFDVGIMPFAHNEATRFISPTKTPEYLAAGLPVASTSIRDVVHPYADRGLVHVGDGVQGFVAAVDAALRDHAGRRLPAVDAFLADRSWDATWAGMWARVEHAISQRAPAPVVRSSEPAGRAPWPVAAGGRLGTIQPAAQTTTAVATARGRSTEA